ncbi:MAG: hypothetical protein ACQGVC_24790 [Myxococcota bacterium]
MPSEKPIPTVDEHWSDLQVLMGSDAAATGTIEARDRAIRRAVLLEGVRLGLKAAQRHIDEDRDVWPQVAALDPAQVLADAGEEG